MPWTFRKIAGKGVVIGDQITASGEFTNLGASGTLQVDGITTLNALANISSVAVTNGATVGTTLGVTGATTLSSTLGVLGAATLSSTLGVTGATTLSSTLGVTGATTLTGDTSIGGAAIAGQELTVNGDATVTGDLTAGNLVVDNINASTQSVVAAGTLPDDKTAYIFALGAAGTVNIPASASVDGRILMFTCVNGNQPTVDAQAVAGKQFRDASGTLFDSITLQDGGSGTFIYFNNEWHGLTQGYGFV